MATWAALDIDTYRRLLGGHMGALDIDIYTMLLEGHMGRKRSR